MKKIIGLFLISFCCVVFGESVYKIQTNDPYTSGLLTIEQGANPLPFTIETVGGRNYHTCQVDGYAIKTSANRVIYKGNGCGIKENGCTIKFAFDKNSIKITTEHCLEASTFIDHIYTLLSIKDQHDLEDNRLNYFYQLVMKKLSPDDKIILRNHQRQWIKDRDAICGNEKAGNDRIRCKMLLTRKRATELEELFLGIE